MLYEHGMQIAILWEDDQFIAVEKPAGLASIPGRGEEQSVLDVLGRQLKMAISGTADPRLRIVHRLDKGTSGVLLLAKNQAAQRHVAMQFQNGQVKKQYLAIVAGEPGEPRGVIDAPLAPNPNSRDRMMVSRQGKPAVTEWQVVQRMRRFALLRCFPRTGRTHQIRVHLKSIGLPLAVDPLYNSPATEAGIFLSRYKRDYRPTRGEEERPLIARLTLHAEKLEFQHSDGQQIIVESRPPKDFRATVNQLGKLSR